MNAYELIITNVKEYQDLQYFKQAKAIIEALKRGNVYHKRKDGSVEEESYQGHEFYYDMDENAIIVTYYGAIYERLKLEDFRKTWSVGIKKEDLQ